MSDEGPAIGIDLGTTYSCVGVFEDDRVKIIPNENGYRITPSCVSFTADGHIVGDDAKYRLTMNPRNTVIEVKRLMGRSFDDPLVARDTRYWPFEVANADNKPQIVVYPGGDKPVQKYSPEEISAKVLQKMKAIAEKYLKKTVRKAVITVPAYFNESQRQATKTAGQIAGLEVMRIINEPEAAAIAYGLEKRTSKEKQVLVFDLGGGTFDVSVLAIEEGIIEVKAKCGDTRLGGSDFDNAMVDHCIEWFNRKHSTQTKVTNDAATRPFNRLRRACEFAKCRLSQDDEGCVRVEQFHEELDFYKSVSKDTFEQLNKANFEKTLDLVKQAMKDAKVSREDIAEVLLVGGSTRIPILQTMLQEFFGGKDLNKSINPDEAVAYGAAIQAAILNDNVSEKLEGILLLDITPLSLGIEVKGEIMSTIINRNTLIPIKKTSQYATSVDDQTEIIVTIYQGERRFVKDNQRLGSFLITDLPKAPAGVLKIDVTFEMDSNGILDVIAEDLATGNEEYITIDNCAGRVTNAAVERMVREADINKTEDEAECKRMQARNDLETYVNWTMLVNRECNLTQLDLTAARQGQIKQLCDDITTWLNTGQMQTEAEYCYKNERLVALCVEIPPRFKTPGNLPNELKTKYKVSTDNISLSSMHTVNMDLD